MSREAFQKLLLWFQCFCLPKFEFFVMVSRNRGFPHGRDFREQPDVIPQHLHCENTVVIVSCPVSPLHCIRRQQFAPPWIRKKLYKILNRAWVLDHPALWKSPVLRTQTMGFSLGGKVEWSKNFGLCLSFKLKEVLEGIGSGTSWLARRNWRTMKALVGGRHKRGRR